MIYREQVFVDEHGRVVIEHVQVDAAEAVEPARRYFIRFFLDFTMTGPGGQVITQRQPQQIAVKCANVMEAFANFKEESDAFLARRKIETAASQGIAAARNARSRVIVP
jgi:hypothetical protein